MAARRFDDRQRGPHNRCAAVPSTFAACLLVGAGGFAGAIARFLVARTVGGLSPTAFPLATFLINVSGSFLLGVIGGALAERPSPDLGLVQLAAGVGFLGAFTTFSTFELETHALADNGAWVMAAIYVATSVLAGFAAVRAGVVIGRGMV
jgi:CrcB protein